MTDGKKIIVALREAEITVDPLNNSICSPSCDDFRITLQELHYEDKTFPFFCSGFQEGITEERYRCVSCSKLREVVI